MLKGYTTKSRTEILNYLKTHKEQAVTIQEIYSSFEQEEIRMNLTTIYRYLNQLTKEGLVMIHMRSIMKFKKSRALICHFTVKSV